MEQIGKDEVLRGLYRQQPSTGAGVPRRLHRPFHRCPKILKECRHKSSFAKRKHNLLTRVEEIKSHGSMGHTCFVELNGHILSGRISKTGPKQSLFDQFLLCLDNLLKTTGPQRFIKHWAKEHRLGRRLAVKLTVAFCTVYGYAQINRLRR